MILECSRGHRFDTAKFTDRWNYPNVAPGKRCPMLMAYSIMDGPTYCRRVLKEATCETGETYETHTP